VGGAELEVQLPVAAASGLVAAASLTREAA
jgi:hypothetical protein